uniref:adenylate kinase n=1 Tax=Nicotiana tabacum TaxID=4097 RepID=A0A1S4B9K7_TOBAC|nr:PREDICTED: probable adenylate kinase 7, mitochondrial [Nicotiana tabacum]
MIKLQQILFKLLRAYGSAAAAQLDYYKYEEAQKRNWMMAKAAGSIPRRGVRWLIMGDPMTNRHVYARWPSELLDVPYISMGSLVRQELHPHYTLYNKVSFTLLFLMVNYLCLYDEEVIFGLLSKRLEEGYCRGESGFILDGIPRTKLQAEILDKVVDIDLVLNLKCSNGGNRIYSPVEFLRRGISRINLGQQTESDNLRSSTATDKQNVHAEQVKPLEEYYRKQKKLVDFQVGGGPAETWQGLLAALHLQHMSAVVSTQLTAGC